MTFHSILFQNLDDRDRAETAEEPVFFVDLNLDQIIDGITAGRQDYNLKPFYYVPLRSIDAIEYRHEVMRDLEERSLSDNIKAFARRLRLMREHLAMAGKMYYKYQKESWFLDAVQVYCDAVRCLDQDLSRADLKSRGLLALRDYVATYAASDRFTSLLEEARKVKSGLASVRYCLRIKGNALQVRRYESEIDYTVEVNRTFEKFKQGAVKDHLAAFSSWPEMNHVEAQVLDRVAWLHPDIFSSLDDFCSNNSGYLDETIGIFDREVQFYLAYLDFVAMLKGAGLKFCYPRVVDQSKEVYDYEGYDLALARKLISEKSPVVCNDFHLEGSERIIVVSGPNQGGKTTFARTFGQLHYMASLGCPVAGRAARLFLFDTLFTHFEQPENLQNLRGTLENDLVRIHDILEQATARSIVIVNEIFASTTLHDAIFLGMKLMERISELDLLCVCVTFVDELASWSEKTISMVSTVAPENPTLRTYKILRRPPDGLAYAISIAEKHQLTYRQLRERIAS